jgi:hypothetical protein
MAGFFSFVLAVLKGFIRTSPQEQGTGSISLPIEYTGDKEMGDFILTRNVYSDITSQGELCQNGKHLVWTLEPPINNPKEPKCIPPCRAQIVMQWSSRFQRDTPHLLGVPGRTLIEIHPLNDEHLVTMPDGTQHWTTEGCIGPGLTKDKDWVGSSVAALTDIVIPAVEAALKVGPLYIQIIDTYKGVL